MVGEEADTADLVLAEVAVGLLDQRRRQHRDHQAPRDQFGRRGMPARPGRQPAGEHPAVAQQDRRTLGILSFVQQRYRDAASLTFGEIFREAADVWQILLVGPHRIDENIRTFTAEAFGRLPDGLAHAADGEAQADVDRQHLQFRLWRLCHPAVREALCHQDGIGGTHQGAGRDGGIEATAEAAEQIESELLFKGFQRRAQCRERNAELAGRERQAAGSAGSDEIGEGAQFNHNVPCSGRA